MTEIPEKISVTIVVDATTLKWLDSFMQRLERLGQMLEQTPVPTPTVSTPTPGISRQPISGKAEPDAPIEKKMQPADKKALTTPAATLTAPKTASEASADPVTPAAAAPATPVAAAAPEPKFTREQVLQALKDYSAANSKAAAVAVLNSFGAATLAELPDDKFAAVIAALQSTDTTSDGF